MFESLLIGIGGIVALAVIWVIVQSAWKNVFADHISDEDVLAGRSKCSNCGCVTVCKENNRKLTLE